MRFSILYNDEIKKCNLLELMNLSLSKFKNKSMSKYIRTYETLWADMDPNRHMRHTAYNDYAAQVRVAFMAEHSMGLDTMEKLHIGPVLFREETKFLKEVRMGEIIKVDMCLAGMSKDGERWKMVHHVFKQNEKIAAIITVDGAWIDMHTRKLTSPPEEMLKYFEELDKTEDYLEIVKRG